MTYPAIKRSTANRLAKFIRDDIPHGLQTKEEFTTYLAKFFKSEDHFFRDDIFINVASGVLKSDPAIKNPKGFNQYGNKKNEV